MTKFAPKLSLFVLSAVALALVVMVVALVVVGGRGAAVIGRAALLIQLSPVVSSTYRFTCFLQKSNT